jgi:hypothetical protein
VEKRILKAEVTNISEHGFWILLADKEYFLPFEKYPWFKDARISSITNIQIFHNHHLYWPDLDVDLTTEILEKPDNYPLTYKESKKFKIKS